MCFYFNFPDTVPIRTVNRQCSSGLQAVADVAAYIKAGFYEIGIGCGVESMSIDQIGPVSKVNPKVSINSFVYAFLSQKLKVKGQKSKAYL